MEVPEVPEIAPARNKLGGLKYTFGDQCWTSTASAYRTAGTQLLLSWPHLPQGSNDVGKRSWGSVRPISRTNAVLAIDLWIAEGKAIKD